MRSTHLTHHWRQTITTIRKSEIRQRRMVICRYINFSEPKRELKCNNELTLNPLMYAWKDLYNQATNMFIRRFNVFNLNFHENLKSRYPKWYYKNQIPLWCVLKRLLLLGAIVTKTSSKEKTSVATLSRCVLAWRSDCLNECTFRKWSTCSLLFFETKGSRPTVWVPSVCVIFSSCTESLPPKWAACRTFGSRWAGWLLLDAARFALLFAWAL